jgi:hypothetical protein
MLNVTNKTNVKFKSTNSTESIYLSNLAGTDYELPEDDSVVSKYVETV